MRQFCAALVDEQLDLFARRPRAWETIAMRHLRRWVRLHLAIGSLALLSGAPSPRAQAATAEAYAGEPFGVGRVTVSVGGVGPVAPLEDERFTVEAAGGRALYPVLKEERVRRLVRQLLEIDRPRSATIYFLFRGDEPLELRAFAPTSQTVRISPQRNPGAHARLLGEWWQQYAGRWQNLRLDPRFPPFVENFLAANLARRLGLTLPLEPPGLLARLTQSLRPDKTIWDDLFFTERHLLTIDQSLVASSASGEEASLPLPAPMPWYELNPPGDELRAVPVEPLAAHVPVECFYLRFGTFSNYLWFRDLTRKWQGDLGNMIVRRGVVRATPKRIEQQLSLRESALSKILGPQVIADVALIALDPYLNHGAAVGILFQARSNPLLARDLTAQRREALEKFPDAAETTVRLGDRDVSLIATPDGEVRSYYVADGDFHLVTTSEWLAQRFLRAGAGEQALAASTGFLSVRQRLPHDRGDALFAFISPEFVRALTGPPLWIEAYRSARSARAARVWQLARQEAAAEGVDAHDIDQLVAAGLLPNGFAAWGDGSRLAEVEAGIVDTLRGRPGLFTPASDQEVTGATESESAAYRRFSDRFQQEIGQTPPVGVSVLRQPRPAAGGETLSVDMVAMPLDRVKLGRLPEILGAPSDVHTPPVAGDVLHAEFVLAAPPLPLLGGENELHHLFAGVRDFRAPLVIERGAMAPVGPPTELVRMYVGAWPKPGLLKLFAGQRLADGPEPAPAAERAWQAKRDDFLVISFKPDVIREVLPLLATAQAERPAQAWIDVGNLSTTQLAEAVNALGYMRTRETAVAASRLMNTLANQLHVPREQARGAAEQLVDGSFVCPLGGEYAMVEIPGGLPMWTSTAVAPQNRFLLTSAPEGFTLPVLTWFEGLRGDLRLDPGELSLHLEIDMATSAMP